MIVELRDFFQERLKAELPGERAHVEMAPIHRPLPQEARKWTDTRFSGVLILIYPEADKLNTALMRRPDYGGVHSGQISFPGGRKEDSDRDIIHTALREAEEEMNIRQDEVQVIGSLSDLYIPPSKSLVTPVLGFAEKKPDFRREEREVAEIIEADLFDILSDEYFQNTEVVTSSYLMKEVPAIIYSGFTIWGATAMMMNELKWLMREFRIRS